MTAPSPSPAIKLCGIRTGTALAAASAAGADYAGLVFYPPSPRHVSLAEAAALAGQARIALVGLFVDADDAAIGEAVAAARLGAIQLHGRETPERAAAVRARFGLPVWKAVRVAGAADVAGAVRYAGAADLILFDAKAPEAHLSGGTGLAFDWALLSGGFAGSWGLAGGLTPGNVAAALRATGAPLVDVSSGVETAPGVKDEALIAAFCRAARAR